MLPESRNNEKLTVYLILIKLIDKQTELIYASSKNSNVFKWSRSNFSLQFQYSFKGEGDERKEDHQGRDTFCDNHQILRTSVTRNVW